MTPALLATCTGSRIDRAQEFAGALSAAMAFYGIDTPLRQAAFLAQIGHESGGLKYTSELWGPTSAQSRYEGRKDLGNNQPGDGSKYRGHGLIQTTGRANHARVRDRLRARFDDVPDFETHPEALTQTKWAALSATDYWDDHRLNALADSGQMKTITRIINGGENGLEDRLARYKNALKVLA